MSVRLIEPTPSAFRFPLLIKHLLKPPLSFTPDREIVYRDRVIFRNPHVPHLRGRIPRGHPIDEGASYLPGPFKK